MKYLKILTVAAVAAAALMAFAGTASATTVTSGGKTLGAGATLHSVLKEGEAILKSSFIGEVKCKESTVAGSIGNAGGAGTESGAATFTAKSAAIPRTGGRSGAFCGSSASWNATYTLDEVNGVKGANLYVH